MNVAAPMGCALEFLDTNISSDLADAAQRIILRSANSKFTTLDVAVSAYDDGPSQGVVSGCGCCSVDETTWSGVGTIMIINRIVQANPLRMDTIPYELLPV